ncbi:MAG: XRE family transcriptional regulator [Deltaproteobacteria bacterium HGW-Deltaproteobacteria-15]|jgi:transcriptional regulator with XRE-family HTH domain|nr:MAG: XRE family transcriptional regulator [Deltaproteobacteria bacterium HGW-Deltaproteobacteria-15]
MEKDKKTPGSSYDNFLEDIGRFAGGDQEKAFLDSIGEKREGEDVEIHVGERVRRVRESRGLTLQDVCQRTGLDPGTLTGIEQGTLAPPLGVIIRLAKALEMRMGYFISGEEEKPFTIVRRRDRKVVSRYDAKKGKYYGYEFESLAPYKKDRHMEPFLVTLEPAPTEHERSAHEGQEFIYVLNGEMEVRLGEEIHILEPGDAIYYDSNVPHLVKCRGDQATKILAVLYAEK